MKDKYDDAGILIRPIVKLDSDMDIEQLHIRMGEMAAEIERLQSVIDEANSQVPVVRVLDGRVVDFNPNYDGDVSNGEFFARPIPAQQSPAVAVPEIFKKVIFEQPEETKELVIGVDDNDCPYFILGSQKFRLDPTVIENRDQAKWYQKQLSIAFEKFISGEHIRQSPRVTEQDAREIIDDYIGFCDGKRLKPQSSAVIGMYMKNEFSALLDRLSRDKNGK